jgi:hypothetical protein
MKAETVTDALLREFLLGKVNEEERERIECLFLTDSQARERILAVEQDLIDDYLEQNLTSEDRERFVSRYEETAKQRLKLRIARSINDWAQRESPSTRPLPTSSSGGKSFRTRLRLEPKLIIPIAAIVIIAIFVAALLLTRLTDQRKRERLAIEQELAQLNAPASLAETPSQMVSVDLLPVTTRSGQQQQEVKTGSQIRIVQFQLGLGQQQRYFTYQLEVRRLEAAESFVIPNLHDQKEGTYVRLRLPTSILKRGQYEIELTGVSAGGSLNRLQDYTFTVVE